MSNPTSMQMFQQDVQDSLVAGFMSYPEPEPVEQIPETEEPLDENEGTSIGEN